VDMAFGHLARIPCFRYTVLAERVEGLAVGRVDEPADGSLVGEYGVGELAFLRRRFPDANAPIHAPRREVLAVGRPRGGVNPAGRIAERGEPNARGHVPHLRGPVRRGRGEELALRMERDAVDGVAVVLEVAFQLPGRHVPHLDDAIVSRAG